MVSYLIATTKGIWPIVIIGIVLFAVILYVVETQVKSFGIAKTHKNKKHNKIRKTTMSYEFKKIYNYIEEQYVSELEENRKKLIKSIIICLVLFIIAVTLCIIFEKKTHFSTRKSYSILGIIFLPAVLYYVYKYKKYNDIYVKSFKDTIIKNFVKYINHNLEYHQKGGKNLFHYYLDAKFEDKQFNDFTTDDYIEGINENGTNIEMCNIALENYNNNGEFLNMVYEGIFSVTKLNNYVTGEIRIKKNQYILKNKHNKVEMDNNEFEKYFDVYSNSNILAMQILTHDIMEELLQFYNTYKINCEIVIKDNNIYIRFDTGVMFEPNILKKTEDMNTLWVYYSVLKFVTNFTVKVNKLLKDLDV